MDEEAIHIQQEIEQFNHYFKQFPFQIVDKIGQGTFSSVYKALDLHHRKYDNSKWCNCKTNKQCGYVALKRIYATSSPNRIFTELALLHCLGDHANIAPLITAFRHEDQVVAVLPYFSHDQFKVLKTNQNYYKKMESQQIKCYLRALLSALKHVHTKGYIHRDVKPSNFLYRIGEQTGQLIDFGLAQCETDYNAPKDLFKQPKPKRDIKTKFRPGYIPNDSSIRANRAGTRGFRAPEVLFKVVQQTRAIDIWAVGVILLSILSHQFPFFQSSDDTDALIEVSQIFGLRRMQNVANIFDRQFESNIPDLKEGIKFEDLIKSMRGEDYKEDYHLIRLLEGLLELDPSVRLTAEEALRHEFFD